MRHTIWKASLVTSQTISLIAVVMYATTIHSRGRAATLPNQNSSLHFGRDRNLEIEPNATLVTAAGGQRAAQSVSRPVSTLNMAANSPPLDTDREHHTTSQEPETYSISHGPGASAPENRKHTLGSQEPATSGFVEPVTDALAPHLSSRYAAMFDAIYAVVAPSRSSSYPRYAAHGIPAERFDAVLIDDIDLDAMVAEGTLVERDHRARMRDIGVAVYLSHVGAIARFLNDSTAETVLILEDDLYLDADANETLRDVVAMYEKLPSDWGMWCVFYRFNLSSSV